MAGQSGNSGDNFNPQARLQGAQDFTQFSKGFRDTSAGDFTTGIAQDLDVGLQAIDRGVAQSSEDEVRNAVESTDTQLLGIKNQGPAADPLDKEVRGQVRNLSDKKLAMDAGTIDPQHYYATIQARLKDIRSRYFGYNDTIDSELSKLGIDPNWQRKQIIEEGLKAQNARAAAGQEAAKNDREFVEAAINNPKLVMLPEDRARLADPNFSKDPNNMKFLKLKILQTNDLYSRMEMDKTAAETSTAVGGQRSKQLSGAYDRRLQTGLFAASQNSGAFDLAKKAALQVQDDQRRNGGVVTAEHDLAFKQAWQSFRQQMEMVRVQATASFSDSNADFIDDKKKVDDAFTAQMDNLEKAFNDKTWGLFGANLASTEARINGARSRQLGNSETVASMAGLRANLGDQASNQIYLETMKAHPAIVADTLNSVKEDEVNGKIKSLNESMVKMRDAGINDPAAYRDALTINLDQINNKDAKMTGRLALFETTFGEGNRPFWDNLMANGKLSSEEKRRYYRTLTSPQMQSSITEMGQADRGALTKYYAYVKYMFQGMNQDTSTEVNDAVKNSSNSTIVYNPKTFQLEQTPYDNPGSTLPGRVWDKSRATTSAIQNFNDGIAALVPLWKAQGLDPAEETANVIQQMGIDLNAPKGGNAVDAGVKAASDWFGKVHIPVPDIFKGGNNDYSIAPQGVRQGSENLPWVGGQGNPQLNQMPARDDPRATPGKPYFLGGPGQNPTDGMGTPQGSTPDARTAQLDELKQMQGLIEKETDPAHKAELIKDRDSILQEYRTGRYTNYDTLDSKTRGGVDAQYPPNADRPNDSASADTGQLPPNPPGDHYNISYDGYGEKAAKGLKTTQDAAEWDAYYKSNIQGMKNSIEDIKKDNPALYRWTSKEKFLELNEKGLKDVQQQYKEFKKNIPDDLEDRKQPQAPMNLGGPENLNTKDGKMEPGLGQSDNEAVNALVGHQDFLDAVKSGDPKEIAKQALLQLANIIPFPGAKVEARAGMAALEHAAGGEVINAGTLEARRIAKEMDAADLSKLSGKALNDEIQRRGGHRVIMKPDDK